MDKLVSAPTKVLNVLSPTGSAKSVESMSSEPDAPKEYRNLLMDMSDGKSDHIMWINCLKSYDWYGEGNFSFNMDKFGVPVLKNGDYKLNLSIECVDRYVDDSETDHNGKHLIYWEGNYWTPTEDDCIIVPVQTQALLVNKAANVLKTLGVGSGDTVLVISPFIIQIPIILMATIRIGAVFSLFNATNKSDSDLSEAILLANSKVVITADCFWYGGSVINVKRNVDAAMEIVKEKTEVLPQIVVIQHGAPNPGLPPIPEENRVIGRRPIYGVEVPFDPENEFRWSDLMLAAEENCIPKLMDTEDLMIKNIRKRHGKWVIRSYSTSQMALLAAVLKETFGDEPCGAIWPLLDADNLIFVTSLLAIPHSSSSLLLFEGKLDHPNPDRFWNIINKYKVEKLLLNIDSLRLLMEKQIHLANASGRTLKVILTVFTNKADTDLAARWISMAFPNAKHIPIVY